MYKTNPIIKRFNGLCAEFFKEGCYVMNDRYRKADVDVCIRECVGFSDADSDEVCAFHTTDTVRPCRMEISDGYEAYQTYGIKAPVLIIKMYEHDEGMDYDNLSLAFTSMVQRHFDNTKLISTTNPTAFDTPIVLTFTL